MYRIWTDYNNREENGWIRFNTNGSREDMKHMPDLHDGMKVVAHDDEFEIEVILRLRQGPTRSYWLGEPVSDFRDVT